MSRRSQDTPPVTSHGANLRPLYDRLVVKRLPVPAFSPGGLIVRPNHQDMKSDRGRVLAVGQGKLLDNGELRRLDVAVGDIVIFALYQRDVVNVDRKELLLLREDEVLAVEDPNDLSDEAKAGLEAADAEAKAAAERAA